ncbi:MAG: M20/M25/M40 family metallo-hydrolase [Chloroflexota bacterium]|nr:M20/M25/M40 family metallo-hydrolase [Chloroflexota bacterium]
MQAIAASLAALGHEARTDSFVAVSDLAWFAEAGIPAVIFGPGLGLGSHTSDERIEIDALVEGTKALALSMMAWCGVNEAG